MLLMRMREMMRAPQYALDAGDDNAGSGGATASGYCEPCAGTRPPPPQGTLQETMPPPPPPTVVADNVVVAQLQADVEALRDTKMEIERLRVEVDHLKVTFMEFRREKGKQLYEARNLRIDLDAVNTKLQNFEEMFKEVSVSVRVLAKGLKIVAKVTQGEGESFTSDEVLMTKVIERMDALKASIEIDVEGVNDEAVSEFLFSVYQ